MNKVATAVVRPSHLSKIRHILKFIYHTNMEASHKLITLSEPNDSTVYSHINTLCKNGKLIEIMSVLQYMDRQQINLDSHTYSSILQACISMKALTQGKILHARLITGGFEHNAHLAATLVSMYAIFRNMEDARQVFDKMSERNVFLWNAMISGYAKNELSQQAMTLYCDMQGLGIKPNNFTFPCALKVCDSLLQGKKVHSHVLRSGFETDVVVCSAIVTMYAKFGDLEFARRVFDKMPQRDFVPTWNAMIAGYAQSGCVIEALKLFRQMLLEGIDSSPMTLTIVLPVCSYLENLQLGKRIHGFVFRRGFDWDIFVGSALIDLYAKCRCVEVARQVFDKMPEANVVSWTAMIACYARNEHANDALKCFRLMQLAGVKPNQVTIMSVLPACAQLAALQQGKEIHQYVFQIGFMSSVSVGNALIDMYSKCGSINSASRVFRKIIDKNVVSWSAMIAGFGMHGKGESALELFNQMQCSAIEPDHVTFIGVLSACSHAGLVDEGWQYFNMMRENYGISPVVEHYACMVDLLGRAGQLHEAQKLIEKMPLEPSSSVWGALLSACRVHNNLELGEHAFKWLLELEPENVGNYILLTNIYAAVGRWDGVAKVRIVMKDRSLRKVPGYSWILVKNSVHTFLVGDESHPKMNNIHAILKNLVPEMTTVGYVPDFHCALYDDG